MPLDIGFVQSPVGLTKIGEIIFLLVAFACLSDSNDDTGELGASYGFFIFVTVTLWLLAIVLFVLFVTRFHENVNVAWVPSMLVFSAVACLMLLIASSLIADKSASFAKNPINIGGEYKTACDSINCGNVAAAAVFGFFSLCLFAVDAVFYFIKYRGPPPGAENLGGPEAFTDPEGHFDGTEPIPPSYEDTMY